MNDERKLLRQAFSTPLRIPAKVTATGFEIHGDEVRDLSGRIRSAQLVRKYFEDGVLACSSPDGIHGDGGKKLCDACRHPNCQPRLRIQLDVGDAIYVIELNATSARNYLALDDQANASGVSIGEWLLCLSIVGHQHWGEVRFQRLDPPA